MRFSYSDYSVKQTDAYYCLFAIISDIVAVLLYQLVIVTYLIHFISKMNLAKKYMKSRDVSSRTSDLLTTTKNCEISFAEVLFFILRFCVSCYQM